MPVSQPCCNGANCVKKFEALDDQILDLLVRVTGPSMIPFHRLDERAVLPVRKHTTDSGLDLYAIDQVIIEPMTLELIHTGLAVSLPEGYEATIRPKSGLTTTHWLFAQFGTIDQGYTGELGISVFNAGKDPYVVTPYQAVAQLVISRVIYPTPAEAILDRETDRGDRGFGSTGLLYENVVWEFGDEKQQG